MIAIDETKLNAVECNILRNLALSASGISTISTTEERLAKLETVVNNFSFENMCKSIKELERIMKPSPYDAITRIYEARIQMRNECIACIYTFAPNIIDAVLKQIVGKISAIRP